MSSDKDSLLAEMKQDETLTRERDRVLRMVQEDLQRRNQSTHFFRGETLLSYTDVSIGQFIGHREKPEWKKDYQYNVFDPVTRDKVMAILAKSSGLYEAQFFNTNKRMAKASELISTVLAAFYQDSTRMLKEKEKNKLLMLDALTRPKAIWYEGWRNQKRTIREIEERDENGEVTKTKEKKIVHYNGPWGEAVHVKDFIPGSLKIRDLQEQPRVTWAPKMQMERFQRMFPVSRYPEAAKVKPYHTLLDNELTNYTARDDLKENEVEVIRCFEKWDDRMTIIANGILLTKPNTPMPFAHKDYPFVWGGFEELDSEFIYDMPLPIKILDMQDMDNEVLNLTLDMVWRALNEVILVQGGDGINDDTLYGGGFVDVADPKNFQKLEFGSSFGFQSAQAMRDAARRSIEASSVDAYQSGQAQGNETARGVLAAREAAMEITTLFLNNMENMERDKAFLRVKNQLDRYHRPADWERRIGAELTAEAVPVFREISLRDARLEGGKRGSINISITEEPRSKEELDELNVQNDKELSQTIDVTPEFIRNIEFDVEIVPGSVMKKSKSMQVAEARAYLNDAAAMPNVLNPQYAAKKYVKALGEKEDEALTQTPDDPMAAMMSGQPGAGQRKPIPSNAPDSIESILNAQM